jgi:hypothetical protein
MILYDVKRLIQKQALINLLLGRLALSHLRLIRFPFRLLLRLAGITVEVFLPASTRERNLPSWKAYFNIKHAGTEYIYKQAPWKKKHSNQLHIVDKSDMSLTAAWQSRII